MTSKPPSPSIVSCEELKQLIDQKRDIKVLDASWFLPSTGRNARSEFNEARIPGSIFFDIDLQFASNDPHLAHLPHMLPSTARFEEQATLLGLSNTDDIYLYDRMGVFSVCRAWFLFHLFGHETVRVVDGGFPRWLKLQYPVESGAQPAAAAAAPAPYKAKAFHGERVRTMDNIRRNLEVKQEVVLDARPRERWAGAKQEPRAGVKSGRIPGALSLPLDALLTEDRRFKSAEGIRGAVEQVAGLKQWETVPVVASCGSGLTACAIYFCLNQILGKKNVSLYDGSMAEWGLEANKNPVEKD